MPMIDFSVDYRPTCLPYQYCVYATYKWQQNTQNGHNDQYKWLQTKFWHISPNNFAKRFEWYCKNILQNSIYFKPLHIYIYGI